MDTAIDIGFRRRISDIPAQHGMKENKKISAARQLAHSKSAVHDHAERLRAILETAVEGIITIDELTVFFSATCERQGELTTTKDFHAWMCGEARGALGFIEGALVSSVLSTHSE